MTLVGPEVRVEKCVDLVVFYGSTQGLNTVLPGYMLLAQSGLALFISQHVISARF
jgi:hypothetical protein